MMEKLSLIPLIFILPSYQKVSSANSESCGKPLGQNFLLVNDRIVSGYDIGYYRYPWYAALLMDGSVSCGGSLIGPKTVLTAAHCYGDFMSNKAMTLEKIYTVKLGVYNICSTEATAKEFTVEKVHVHELYREMQPYYDICVIILSESTEDFMPICLPQRVIGQRPKEATVPGLGTLRFKGAMPCTVHEARILIYSDDICREMIQRTGNNGSEIVNAFCAGYMQGGIDTCQGDSGGPLQIMAEDGTYVVSGIVSFGFRCALPGLLGVYTDVSQYLDWIYNKTSIKYSSSNQHETKSPSKPHLLRPYWKPIRVIIIHGNKVIVLKKIVLHRPIQ